MIENIQHTSAIIFIALVVLAQIDSSSKSETSQLVLGGLLISSFAILVITSLIRVWL